MFMFINRAYLGPHLQAIVVVVELRNLLRPGVGQSIDRVVLGKNAEMKVNIYDLSSYLNCREKES